MKHLSGRWKMFYLKLHWFAFWTQQWLSIQSMSWLPVKTSRTHWCLSQASLPSLMISVDFLQPSKVTTLRNKLLHLLYFTPNVYHCWQLRWILFYSIQSSAWDQRRCELVGSGVTHWRNSFLEWLEVKGQCVRQKLTKNYCITEGERTGDGEEAVATRPNNKMSSESSVLLVSPAELSSSMALALDDIIRSIHTPWTSFWGLAAQQESRHRPASVWSGSVTGPLTAEWWGISHSSTGC